MNTKLNKSIFANNARVIRISMSKTQDEFAELLGCKRANVGAIEEGRSWNIDVVYKYSRIANVNMEFLILYKINLKDEFKPKIRPLTKYRYAKRIEKTQAST